MSDAARERPSILIVEDELVVAMDLERSLVQLGYEVAGIADSADEAMRLVRDRSPDLVLMDIQLAGDRDGIAAAEEIGRECQIPVVFVTAHTNPETLGRAKLARPLGYLAKPFRTNELNATVVVALHQHRLEREWFAEHAWLTTLLASLGEGVIATDAGGRVRYLNPAAESLTGWTQTEAAGRTIEQVYPLLTEAGEVVEVCQLRSALMRREAVPRQAFWLRNRSGKQILIEDVAAPIVDARGKVTGAAALFIDVTERRRAERERERLFEELERSNTELARFSFAVSHDLQTPVRTIRSFAELLRRRTEPKLAPDEVELLTTVTEAAAAMQRLIEALLGYAQAGHGPVRREPVPVNCVIQSVGTTLAHLLEETGGQLHYGPLPVVQADRVQLEQLFQNLIGNALKYRRPAVVPEVVVTGDSVPGGWQFAVRDNGPGIPPDERETIFEPLKRLHGREVPGTGLGLALCRTIVERHGGRIWVEAGENEAGATFRFSLACPELGG